MLPELYLHLHHQRELERAWHTDRHVKGPLTLRKRARHLAQRVTTRTR